MRARTIAAILDLLLQSLCAPARGEDRVLRDFPLEVECGVSSPPSIPAARAGARAVVLLDLPFEPSQGYGYVGGEAGTRGPAVVRGGEERWPLVWREGPRKYSFRVPNGEYLLRLTFIETEAAALGLRVFDVLTAEGKLLDAVDIVREAGDFAWLSREALTEVREGWLDLGFAPRA